MKSISRFIGGGFIALVLTACVAITNDIRALRAWEPSSRDPEFVILNLPQPLAQRTCEIMGDFVTPEDTAVLGCVQEIGPFEPGEACFIVMAGDLPEWFYGLILRHEKAHCRGWRHGQPFPEGEFG